MSQPGQGWPMSGNDALIRAEIGRLLAGKTGAATISMRDSIAVLRLRTGTALSDDVLQDLLLEMAEVRGMIVMLDV